MKKGTIFGLNSVDIHTPQHLKDVSREGVGEHMKDHLEREGRIKQPRCQFIGSYFTEEILLGTPLLKWYLAKGLLVTRVYLLV